MSIDGAGVSKYVIGDDPQSSDAGHTDPHEKLTNCPLEPMGVALGASAAAADAETEQLPGCEGLVVVPLEGLNELSRATSTLCSCFYLSFRLISALSAA
jgi:hypothetical protein